ncbi:MAG: hypothetical protein K0R27_4569 [Xanthobacteraceae bacterium]|nr:hypothetical protein [Xanthobacteraceae bacterium]
MPEPSSATASPKLRSRAARLLSLALALVLASLAALVLGFMLFAAGIERQETRLDRAADGIVVLTGGAERIADATQLLASGRGQRLLITGVHPDTTLEEIGRRVAVERQQLECCADIGRSALNTRGNAIETAHWARDRGFRSLIIVTSSWHMPRALVELGRALPDVELVPYPVVTDRMRAAPWWSSPSTSRLLFVEYLKLLAAYVPFRPGPAVTADAH